MPVVTVRVFYDLECADMSALCMGRHVALGKAVSCHRTPKSLYEPEAALTV